MPPTLEGSKADPWRRLLNGVRAERTSKTVVKIPVPPCKDDPTVFNVFEDSGQSSLTRHGNDAGMGSAGYIV